MRVGVFIDLRNLRHSVDKSFPSRRLDYKKYLAKAIGSDTCYAAIAYGMEQHDEATKFKHILKLAGFETRYLRNSTRCSSLSWNVGMTIDIIKLLPRLDKVVIGSASYNFVPLIDYIQEQRILCELFACNIGRDIRELAKKIIIIDENLLQPEESIDDLETIENDT